VGMSAAADDPRYAAERVIVVSTIGKIAAFAGPPLLGLLGDHVTILHALIAVAALQLVAFTITSATRPICQPPHMPRRTAQRTRWRRTGIRLATLNPSSRPTSNCGQAVRNRPRQPARIREDSRIA